jgi:RNA recognition motif-containing protein
MNIYVGNLSYEVSEEDLKKAFETFGEVNTVKIIKDNQTGRSKGFAFVEMSSKTEGQAAIEGLNEKDLKGRNISVNEARPRTEGSRDGARPGGRPPGRGGFGGGGRPGGGRRF